MQGFSIVQTVSCGNQSITTKYATVEDYNKVNGEESSGINLVEEPTYPWEEFQDVVTILKNLYNKTEYPFMVLTGCTGYYERLFNLYKDIFDEDIVIEYVTSHYEIYVCAKGECDKRRFLAVMSYFRTIGTQIIFTENNGE